MNIQITVYKFQVHGEIRTVKIFNLKIVWIIVHIIVKKILSPRTYISIRKANKNRDIQLQYKIKLKNTLKLINCLGTFSYAKIQI